MRKNKVFAIFIIAIFLIFPLTIMADCRCRQIAEYTIVSAYLKESLISEVEKLIKKGWQPFKGIQIIKEGWMYQVMVKYSGEPCNGYR